jgi:hypothetical protein
MALAVTVVVGVSEEVPDVGAAALHEPVETRIHVVAPVAGIGNPVTVTVCAPWLRGNVVGVSALLLAATETVPMLAQDVVQ